MTTKNLAWPLVGLETDGVTTVSGGTIVQQLPIPPNKSQVLQISAIGKTTVAGTSGAIGDSISFSADALFKNVGGVATHIGATPVRTPILDASLSGASLVIDASGESMFVTVTAPTTNGNPTIQWKIITSALLSI